MNKENNLDLNSFIETWEETPEKHKKVFLHLKEYLSKKEGVNLNFITRPGVTFSLRARHSNQKKRELFVMVDVIEDKPRWLSTCFYDEMINDLDELGDYVPEGLLGENAVCFDIEKYDENLIQYLEARLDEAFEIASKE